MREPSILSSASRHGIPKDDILHVYRNPWRIIHVDHMTMIIGADRAGRFLEIGVAYTHSGEDDVIVHAMKARARYLKEPHA